VLLWALIATFSACNQPDDFREWRPDDHDHAGGPPPATKGEGAAAPPAQRPNIDDEVVDVWRLRCARCHGPGGQGNGPEGPMYNTPSLARPDWQATVSDADLRKIIAEGRGRMPPTNLSRPMLDGIVRLVRSLVRQGPMPGATMPPGHPPIAGLPDPPPSRNGSPATTSSAARPTPSSPAPKPAASSRATPSSR